MGLPNSSISNFIMSWKILLNGKTECGNLSWRADAENYIQYVGKAETTERTTCNKREGFNFVYFP
jgi:hypothetical protein